MTRVIVNADDFGLDDDTTAATISAFERGLLTSATIMANMPATDRAIAWAREHPEFSFGVHLVWTSDGFEYPLSPTSEIPSLIESNGQFHGSTRTRVRGLLRLVSPGEIAAEALGQIRRVQSAGIRVSHVDSHGHLHKFGAFRTALRDALPTIGIRKVRTVQDIYLHPRRLSPTVWIGRWWGRRIAESFWTTDHFYMPASDGAPAWQEELAKHLSVVGGTVEIGVHPGSSESWRAEELSGLERLVPQLVASGSSLIDWESL